MQGAAGHSVHIRTARVAFSSTSSRDAIDTRRSYKHRTMHRSLILLAAAASLASAMFPRENARQKSPFKQYDNSFCFKGIYDYDNCPGWLSGYDLLV